MAINFGLNKIAGSISGFAKKLRKNYPSVKGSDTQVFPKMFPTFYVGVPAKGIPARRVP